MDELLNGKLKMYMNLYNKVLESVTLESSTQEVMENIALQVNRGDSEN
ncbi:MAG: hypothetical protein MI808_23930 [Pseudomonadales bacterium]|nr:hypothetical protein [Pseudomonadales bacterium]